MINIINESYSKITVLDENCATLVICSFELLCVACILCESCVCVFFSILVLLNVLELSVASILLNKYTWVALGCFLHTSYHCAVTMIITVFVQAIHNSLLEVGSTYWRPCGDIWMYYISIVTTCLVICWCICDISRYPFSF